MIEIPKSPKQFDKDTGEFSPCMVCGRPIKSENYKSIRVFYGNIAMLESDVIKAYVENKQEAMGADMYWLPVGSECLRNYPELKPYTKPFNTDIGVIDQGIISIKENKLFLTEIAYNQELLEKYPALGNSKQALYALRNACRDKRLPAIKVKEGNSDKWKVDLSSEGFRDWYNAYKTNPRVIGKLNKAKTDSSKQQVVAEFDRKKRIKGTTYK